jgi:predicted deacylase
MGPVIAQGSMEYKSATRHYAERRGAVRFRFACGDARQAGVDRLAAKHPPGLLREDSLRSDRSPSAF